MWLLYWLIFPFLACLLLSCYYDENIFDHVLVKCGWHLNYAPCVCFLQAECSGSPCGRCPEHGALEQLGEGGKCALRRLEAGRNPPGWLRCTNFTGALVVLLDSKKWKITWNCSWSESEDAVARTCRTSAPPCWPSLITVPVKCCRTQWARVMLGEVEGKSQCSGR